jgi:hypothetical protein
VQARHREADRSAHALHLVLAALVQRELETLGAGASGPGRRRAALVEVDAGAQPLELLLGRLALDLDVVDLLDAVARMREAVRQRAVVRQHERTGGVGIETADRDDASLVPDEVDDGRTAVRIARGRDDAGRLVQEDVGEPLRRDGRAVDLDAVGVLDERVQLPGLAVDGHPTRLDQLVRAPPRGDARAGEVRRSASQPAQHATDLPGNAVLERRSRHGLHRAHDVVPLQRAARESEPERRLERLLEAAAPRLQVCAPHLPDVLARKPMPHDGLP